MASLTCKKGRWRLQFRLGSKRPTLRLGKLSAAGAREVKHHIEELVAARTAGVSMRASTAGWLGEIDSTLRNKLVKCGLIEGTQSDAPHDLDGLLRYVMDVVYGARAESTRIHMQLIADNLVECFGNPPLDQMTLGDGEEFRSWLRKRKKARGKGNLSETTVSTRSRKARQFFAPAVKKRWMKENPFSEMNGWTNTNPDRREFISRLQIDRVMKHCTLKYQLILALARYGGLRGPQEILDLRWEWMDFANSRFTVYSSKNRHHPKKRYRSVPMFPELRPYLDEAYEVATPGAKLVIEGEEGNTQKALYSAILKRIERAGIPVWKKIFINLRSSRETELVEQFPIHVVCEWLGHSPKVAAEHYLQVTEKHFEQATMTYPKSDVKSDVKLHDH